MKTQRWQRRKEARAPEILSAALACFAEKGFAATRMEDVAARAGITKGTVYLYFESKEALFKALAQSEIGTRLAEVTERIAGFEGSSADMLRMVLSTMGTIVRTSDGIVLPKVMLAEASPLNSAALNKVTIPTQSISVNGRRKARITAIPARAIAIPARKKAQKRRADPSTSTPVIEANM